MRTTQHHIRMAHIGYLMIIKACKKIKLANDELVINA